MGVGVSTKSWMGSGPRSNGTLSASWSLPWPCRCRSGQFTFTEPPLPPRQWLREYWGFWSTSCLLYLLSITLVVFIIIFFFYLFNFFLVHNFLPVWLTCVLACSSLDFSCIEFSVLLGLEWFFSFPMLGKFSTIISSNTFSLLLLRAL